MLLPVTGATTCWTVAAIIQRMPNLSYDPAISMIDILLHCCRDLSTDTNSMLLPVAGAKACWIVAAMVQRMPNLCYFPAFLHDIFLVIFLVALLPRSFNRYQLDTPMILVRTRVLCDILLHGFHDLSTDKT